MIELVAYLVMMFFLGWGIVAALGVVLWSIVHIHDAVKDQCRIRS